MKLVPASFATTTPVAARATSPNQDPPAEITADFWTLAMTRELDDVILDLRTNEPEVGTWVLRTAGDAARVLAYDRVLLDNRGDWLANEVVPEGQALDAAKRWAAQILECSPMAIRASKQSVYRSLDEPTLQAAMTTSYPAVKANLESQDYIEGPRAFAERRKPDWHNR